MVEAPTVALMMAGAETPTIVDLIEEIGAGRGQLRIAIVACGPFLAEGLELLLVSLLADSIATDLDHDQFAGGIFIFCLLMGTLIGNLASGPIADVIGRQYPIILGYFMVVLFSVVSSFMNSLSSVSSLLFFVGMGYGLGQPAALVLMSEVVPRHWRMATLVAAALFMVVGTLLAVLIVMLNDASLQSFTLLEWRLLLRCSALPVMLLGFASLFVLPESPSFLAATGDYALARDSLQELAISNGKPETNIQFRHSEAEHLSFWTQLRRLMSLTTLLSSFTICFASWVLNFALYGCSYVIPQVLTKVSVGDVLGLAPASVLVLTFALVCACIISGSILGSKGSTKVRLILCMFVSVFCTLLFNASSENAKHLQWSLVLSCIGLWCAPAFAVLSLIQATLDMYPILATTTCTGLCIAVGRLGALAAPLVADYVTNSSNNFSPFFILVATLEFISIFAFLLSDMPISPCSRDGSKVIS